MFELPMYILTHFKIILKDEDIRIPGFPIVSQTDGNGKYYLEGIRANTCQKLGKVTYIEVNAYRQWVGAAMLDKEPSRTFELAVNGLCPLVRKIAPGDKFSTCEKLESLPGVVTGTSKVNWKNGNVHPRLLRPLGFIYVIKEDICTYFRKNNLHPIILLFFIT